ncbi:MAG: phosphoribosylamine--glycine ligase [Coriobacteriia bacterium]|nr:phosphoribosylamine--glycine ligase [Coriobacteriia bacterium]MBN2839359.1 phosphoribosylamine--glycine ligase [Coriobacteriia bacterium]
MRILVLGGGGREHAIVTALSRSPHAPEIFCSPGNGGTAALGTNIEISDDDPAFICEWVERNAIDFVVIGPEAPLVTGVADMLAADGVPAFGPKAGGAHIEGSKAFAKDLMERYDIPSGRYRIIGTYEEAEEYLREVGAPVVVKADGLAAGKGVTVAATVQDALGAVRQCLDGYFGPAGELVVIEEFLEGPECSLLAFTDGETVLPMIPAQDHKRAFDDDEGPNTGGMGVYAPVPVVDEVTLEAMTAILKKTVEALKADGIVYRGVLYGGFILTGEGPKVLEFNARFGDPETQVLLPLLKTDLLDVMRAVAEGRLHEIELEWRDGVALSVVLASGGYPGTYAKGKPINGLDEASRVEGVTIYHAGTALGADGRLTTAGGRVLDVTAVAPTFAEARDRAYEAVDIISFEDMHYRTDIGLKALRAQGDD